MVSFTASLKLHSLFEQLTAAINFAGLCVQSVKTSTDKPDQLILNNLNQFCW